MTTPTTTEPTIDARHPVRRDTDGDFTLNELTAPPTDGPAPRSAAAAARAGRWPPDTPDTRPPVRPRPGDHAEHNVATRQDEELLHTIETSAAVRPPVHEHLDALTPAITTAWLRLAARWIDISYSSGDLRFLNTACKLTGALRLHHRQGGADSRPAGEGSLSLTDGLRIVGHMLGRATAQLTETLSHRQISPEPRSMNQPLPPVRLTGPSRARIVVLAGAGSRSAGRLVAVAGCIGLPVEAVCWFAPHRGEPTTRSNYASAWYPPGTPEGTPPPAVPDTIPATTATSWDHVGAAIRTADADLVLLVGMPIIPAHVLDTTRVGVVNAHNGALPSHRGMDAVGWALLHNQPVVCTLHLARPIVDAGEVIAAQPIPLTPLPTLGARVKTTQLRLLLAGAAHVATTGALPDLTPQPAAGTQFYRLHPHLKRILDASPYAASITGDDTLRGRAARP